MTGQSLAGKCLTFALGLVLASAVSVSGQDKPQPAAVSSGWEKPAWLTDLSVGVKESYDDNIFLSGAAPQYLPATYTVPPGLSLIHISEPTRPY